MKGWQAGAALLALVVFLGIFWKKERTVPTLIESDAVAVREQVTTLAEVNAVGRPLTEAAKQAQGGSPLVEELLRLERPPEQDLETIRQLISQYFTALQNQPGPPIGDNADLVRALTGNNPLRLAVIPPGHAALSAGGQLRDRWGTPYHLHRVSERCFEIRSAGPDRHLFTADDVVGR